MEKRGVKTFGEGEPGGVAWFLFPASKTDDAIREQLEAEGLIWEG